MCSSNLLINGTLIKEKAIRVAERLTSRLQTDVWAGLRSIIGSCIKIFAGKC
jgi:predicted RNA-binding protein